MEISNSISIAAMLLAFGPTFTTEATAETPLEVIKRSQERVLAVYQARNELDQDATREILSIMEEVTDVDGMAQSATVEVCRSLSMEQCRDLNSVFRDILKSTSIHKVGRSRVDRFEYLGEEVDNGNAIVRTLAYHGDEHINLDFVLRSEGGSWKIVNYVTDEVDTVRNYRKQFKKLFSEQSFDEVMRRLTKKLQELEQ
jgi:ABC-type transporter MlaC component